MSVPNQKTIEIDEKSVCDKGNKYTPINLNVLQEAMANLGNTDFKL